MSNTIQFIQGDCMDEMQSQLDPETVDLAVTSPPYNLDIDYNVYDDTIDRSDYLDWIEKWAEQVERVLSKDGSLFLNLGSKPSNPWGPHEVLLRLRDHFELQNEIHWIKSIAINENSYDEDVSVTVGHYKPVNSDRFLNQCHEYVFHLTKSGEVSLDRTAIGVPYKDKSNVDRWDSPEEDLRGRGNTWFVSYKTIHDRDSQRPHPASFPPELAEMAMKLHGLDSINLAMDPFLGIGNSAKAAAKLDLNFIGFEIDEEYLETARAELGEVQKELFKTDI